MALVSIASNYYVVYPVYYAFMAREAIVSAYQAIFPGIADMFPGMDDILKCLIVFNAPFTFVKGLFSVVIAMLVYKPLSPIIKGARRE